MAKDSHKTLLQQLKDPFDPRLVKWTTKGGKSPNPLAYIDARDVMKRLDDVIGADKYKTHYTAVDGGFLCELSLFLKMDDDTYQWITRSDGAGKTHIEPIKGGISDALKRAANAWGIGRYLYYLPKWCNGDNSDKWPEWAKPNASISNWEDVAEFEAELGTGMDSEIEDAIKQGIFGLIEQVTSVENQKDLDKLVKTLSNEEQLELANVINTKKRELLHAARIEGDTSKPSTKK